MDKDIDKRLDEVEEQIESLIKKREKLYEEKNSFFIKENNGFFKELENKSFREKDDKRHYYLALKFNGYNKSEDNFKVLCASFYFCENNMVYSVLNLNFSDAHYFSRRYDIIDKSEFIEKIQTTVDNMVKSLTDM